MLVAVSASVWIWLWHNFYTHEKLAQVHQCTWGLQWIKIMILQQNKWVALNAVMTSYLFLWPSAMYLLSLLHWFLSMDGTTTRALCCLDIGFTSESSLNCVQPRDTLMHIVTCTCSRVWSWPSSRRSFLAWDSRQRRGEQVYTRQRRII